MFFDTALEYTLNCWQKGILLQIQQKKTALTIYRNSSQLWSSIFSVGHYGNLFKVLNFRVVHRGVKKNSHFKPM